MDKLWEEPYPRQMGNKSGHALKLQQHLHDQMLAQSEFCDVTLDIGGAEMKAHWNVLVSCPYFQSLYDSGMKEKQSGKVKISVGKTAAVRSAVTFLYTGQLEISYTTVKDILEVADYLQIDDLKQACASYITSIDVTINNCVSLSLLSSLYDLDIYSKVFDFVRGHLPEVMQQEETLSLTHESVLELLKDTALNYVALEDFFRFIVKWVEHDREGRERYFESLFCELDLKRMPEEFLVSTVEACTLVQQSTACSVHVLNVKMKHMTGLLPHEAATDVVLLVGGCGVGQFFASFFSVPYFPLSDVISVNNIYGYIVGENRWTELAPLPYTMRRPLVAYNNSTNVLYVYDASVESIEHESIYLFKYSVVEKSWTSVRVSLPENCTEITINRLLLCGGRLYLVTSGKYVVEGATVWDWNVSLFRLTAEGDSVERKWKLFPRSTKTQVAACVVDGRFVCVLGNKCGTSMGAGSGPGRAKAMRFVYVDCPEERLVEQSRGIHWEPLMLPMKGEVRLGKPGVYRYRRFTFANRRWSTVKEQLVPHPTEETGRTDFIYTVYEDRLLMFGGKNPVSKKLVDNACSLVLHDKTPSWSNLTTLPKALVNSGVVVAKIPKDLIRCHIDCPHCLYHSVRSQASYQIDFPNNDEEDEDDEDSDLDDGEIYSDYWDDEMYDNMPDYDWF